MVGDGGVDCGVIMGVEKWEKGAWSGKGVAGNEGWSCCSCFGCGWRLR